MPREGTPLRLVDEESKFQFKIFLTLIYNVMITQFFFIFIFFTFMEDRIY